MFAGTSASLRPDTGKLALLSPHPRHPLPQQGLQVAGAAGQASHPWVTVLQQAARWGRDHDGKEPEQALL